MTSAIDSDMLSGLPAAGSNIGGAMKGIAPGAGALILTVGVAKGIGSIPGAIAKRISNTGKAGKKKKKQAKGNRKTNKSRLIHKAPNYKTPLLPKLPKMGPY